MLRNECVSKAIDFIIDNLNEEITIADVADYCHLSKYYLCRIFKAETGEGVYAFIKRLKMEQSAIEMKLGKDKSITTIGSSYGYSSSNYSSAFKKHHHRSPAEFRKTVNTSNAPHPYRPDQLARFQAFEGYDQKIEIRQLAEFRVLYERYLGNYLDLGAQWEVFTAKHHEEIHGETLLIERYYDDPAITRVGQCLYDLCMTIDANCQCSNSTMIGAGKFAVYRFDGLIKDIYETLQGIYNIWLPDSGYEMDERYGLNIYRQIDRAHSQVIMDLCIPVK